MPTCASTADRLASGAFVGTPADTSKVTAMCSAMKRLDAAYLTYRRHADRISNPDAAASATLEAEIGEVRDTADRWR